VKVDSVLDAGIAESGPRAAEAEELGFDGIFSSEVKHDPFLPLAAAAAATSRIQLGTGIAVAFARTPMTLAYLANDLQIMSQGRFILGLGTQVKAHITRRFGMPWSHPAPRLAELIQAIHAIWASWETGENLSFRGEFYTHALMTPMFTPEPHDFGRPKIFAAAVGAIMTEAVSSVADGLMPHGFSTEHYFRQVTLPAVARGLARSGRSRDDFEISAPGFVITGADAESLARSREAVRRQVSFYGSTPAYRQVLYLHGWGALGEELHDLSISSDPRKWDVMATLVDDEVLDTFAVVAEPDKLAQAILGRYGDVVDRIQLGRLPGLSSDQSAALRTELQAADRRSLA
jgi:probable F420-dependent oxidoreductase